MSVFFDGKKWYIPLRNGRIIGCKSDPSGTCSHPEKGWIVHNSLIDWVDQDEYTSIKEEIQVNTPRIVHNSKNTVRTFYY